MLDLSSMPLNRLFTIGVPSIAAGSFIIVIAGCKADSSGCRNTSKMEIAMTTRKRRSNKSGRAPLHSPGRPPAARREEYKQFWASTAKGRNFEAVEFATLEWVEWFNHRRLLEPIGNIPPAEAEERYYAMLDQPALAA